VTPAEFVILFPEFGDATKYPVPRIQLYLTLAAQRVDQYAWGDSYDLGIALFTAHYLATMASAGGGTGAGTVTGEMSSKKVGDVQVSYASTSNRDEGAGWWNSTIYGRQWWSLFRYCGVGVMQLI
jgi:hypothetical protein